MAEIHLMTQQPSIVNKMCLERGKEGCPSWHSLPLGMIDGGGCEADISPFVR